MTGIATVVLLGTCCVIGREIAHRRYHDGLERLFTFGACVLMGAAAIASACEVAL